MSTEFSLERLEHLCYARQHEQATVELWRLLNRLDVSYGELGQVGSLPSGHLAGDLRDAHVATRLANAIAALFSDPQFQLSDPGFLRLIPLQRWLAIIFGASPLGSADHILRLFNQEGHEQRDRFTFKDRDLLRFCLLYGPDSRLPLQPEVLWRKNKRLAASLFFALLSPRIVVTEQAQAKKEMLLEWLRPRLRELAVGEFPIDILQVWMACSYADRPDKHAIKREINEVVRAHLLAEKLADLDVEPAPKAGKPVLLCIVEWFTTKHAMFRGHSLAIASLRSKYHLVGVSLKGATDEAAHKVFDETHVLGAALKPLEAVRKVREIAAALRPAVVYYPSMGMFMETILLASLRLAPIQMTALGHPATTHSKFIDYVLIEEDYVGDPGCFSERLVAMPGDCMPFRPPPNAPKVAPQVRKAPDPVRIAVAATSMKINPRFLATLHQLAGKTRSRVEFHFFSGMTIGLTKVYLQNLINGALPGLATVYPNLTYDSYIKHVNACDLFLNPFPFGNTNGIVDTVRQGLPGVCMTGAEVHSHIDEGLFRRLGLPDWCVTRTPEEYVRAALRLVDDHAGREALHRRLLKTDPDERLFEGNPKRFVEAVDWIQQNHARHVAENVRFLRPPASSRGGKSTRPGPAGKRA